LAALPQPLLPQILLGRKEQRMKRLTFKRTFYGTLPVSDDCPNTPKEASDWVNKQHIRHWINWDLSDVPESDCKIVFIDKLDEKKRVSETLYEG
jgi:hypothetical protein